MYMYKTETINIGLLKPVETVLSYLEKVFNFNQDIDTLSQYVGYHTVGHGIKIIAQV